MAASPPPDAVAFLRGINVGGHTARKEQLVAAVEAAGFSGAGTFLASGNVLFSTGDTHLDRAAARSRVEASLSDAFAAELGYGVEVFARTAAEVAIVAARDPFPGLGADGTVHVGFTHGRLGPAVRTALADLSSDLDHLAVVGREFYWHTAGRMTDSLLGQGSTLARAVSRPHTLRNLNTVRRLTERLRST